MSPFIRECVFVGSAPTDPKAKHTMPLQKQNPRDGNDDDDNGG